MASTTNPSDRSLALDSNHSGSDDDDDDVDGGSSDDEQHFHTVNGVRYPRVPISKELGEHVIVVRDISKGCKCVHMIWCLLRCC